VPIDEQAEQAARFARGEAIDTKKWFDVPDSIFEDDDGKRILQRPGQICRSSHPECQEIPGGPHNVYDMGIVLHTKVAPRHGFLAGHQERHFACDAF